MVIGNRITEFKTNYGAVSAIEIRNYKSIKHLKLYFSNIQNEIVCLIGQNGVGKSNIFKAIRYFWDNLIHPMVDYDAVDVINPYNRTCSIEICFNLEKFERKISGNRFLNDEYQYLKKRCQSEDFSYFTLRMVQSRDGTIRWDHTLEVRKFIKMLVPLYFIDTRRLDILTWDQLWDIISDLASTVPDEADTLKINAILDESFNEIYGSKYDKSKRIIEHIFTENHINLDRYHYHSKFKNTFSMRFGGENFHYDNRPLNYYSDGMNSFMYLKLLLSLISQIASTSCKCPIVLIDEPEIGLHPLKIEELTKSIGQALNGDLTILTNTHSPKLIECIVNQKTGFELYHVELREKYTVCNQMNKSLLLSGQQRVTVMNTSCYFATSLLFVEGQSEVQLFTHPLLRELFPALNMVEVYSLDSNNKTLEYIQPERLNIGIPFILLYDMDKVIDFKLSPKGAANSYSVKLKEEAFNPLVRNKKTEKYRYPNKRNPYGSERRSILRDELNRALQSSYQYASNTLHYVSDPGFERLINAVKAYCELYHMFVNRTTIEGLLITAENIVKFEQFYRMHARKKYPKPDGSVVVKEIIPREFNNVDCRERAALVRGVFHGRAELNKSFNKNLDSCLWDKADGWIPLWLDYYFKHCLSSSQTEQEKRNQFQMNFPELFSALQCVEKMVHSRCKQ